MTGCQGSAGARLLADTLAPAEAAADRHFGDGPAVAWQPPRRGAWRAPSRRVMLAMAIVALFATGAAAVARWMPTGPAPAAEPAPPLERDSELSASPGFDEQVDDTAVEAAAPVARTTPPPAPALTITQHARTWHIDATGVSRLLAAQTFAALSGSALRGSIDALGGSRPLDLHWQGRDPTRAWQALLGTEVSYALQCDARRCQAWIIGDGPAMPHAPVRGAALAFAARPEPSVPAPSLAPAMPATEQAQAQADSPDPHIASHHD